MNNCDSSNSFEPNGTHSVQTMLIRNIIYVSIFAVCSFLFYQQTFSPDGNKSDLPLHLKSIKSIMNGEFTIPHPGFHILVCVISRLFHVSYQYVVVFLLAGFVVLIIHSINMILSSMLKSEYPERFLLLIAPMLVFVSSIYLRFYHESPYLGTWGPNTWHNPTIIASKPFAFLVFHFFPLLLCGKPGRNNVIYNIIASMILLICTLIKPSFTIVFFPAAVLYVLLRHFKDLRAYTRTFILVLPVVLLLMFQFKLAYMSDHKSVVGIEFLAVWHAYARSVPIAIFQAAAFPLIILIFRPRQNFKNNHLFLAWLLFIVATAEFALLIETGQRKYHGNFGWGYIMALHILFIYSMVELLKWAKETDYASHWERIKLTIATTAFSLHFVSGVYFFCRHLVGGGYK